MPVFIHDPKYPTAGGRVSTLLRTPGIHGLEDAKAYMRLNGASEAFIAEQVQAYERGPQDNSRSRICGCGHPFVDHDAAGRYLFGSSSACTSVVRGR